MVRGRNKNVMGLKIYLYRSRKCFCECHRVTQVGANAETLGL